MDNNGNQQALVQKVWNYAHAWPRPWRGFGTSNRRVFAQKKPPPVA